MRGSSLEDSLYSDALLEASSAALTSKLLGGTPRRRRPLGAPSDCCASRRH